MIGQTNKKILKNKLPNKLRHRMTDAEQLLWQAVRSRQLGGYKFRRQHPFHDFILDFVCLEKRIVVEIDGGQHAESQESDKMRSEQLIKAGFSILRFWNHEVLCEINTVKERIWLELQRTGESHPHSFDFSQDRLNPLPEGEESN